MDGELGLNLEFGGFLTSRRVQNNLSNVYMRIGHQDAEDDWEEDEWDVIYIRFLTHS